MKEVVGLQHKKIVLSVGLDKKKVGFDILVNKYKFKHQINYECMNILPNPCVINLYMVQTK